jgi:hypothetical protein
VATQVAVPRESRYRKTKQKKSHGAAPQKSCVTAQPSDRAVVRLHVSLQVTGVQEDAASRLRFCVLGNYLWTLKISIREPGIRR